MSPEGKQIDTGGWNEAKVSGMPQATAMQQPCLWKLVISSINSTMDLKSRGIPMFTSDYALYWFDYLAGYDCVFVEFGWNHSRTQHVVLGRGVASAHGKD